jgi:hypothetical protein
MHPNRPLVLEWDLLAARVEEEEVTVKESSVLL